MVAPHLQVRDMLHELGWSQAEFSRRIDTHRNVVSRWVKGHTRVPGAVLAYLRLVVKLKRIEP